MFSIYIIAPFLLDEMRWSRWIWLGMHQYWQRENFTVHKDILWKSGRGHEHVAVQMWSPKKVVQKRGQINEHVVVHMWSPKKVRSLFGTYIPQSRLSRNRFVDSEAKESPETLRKLLGTDWALRCRLASSVWRAFFSFIDLKQIEWPWLTWQWLNDDDIWRTHVLITVFVLPLVLCWRSSNSSCNVKRTQSVPPVHHVLCDPLLGLSWGEAWWSCLMTQPPDLDHRCLLRLHPRRLAVLDKGMDYFNC